jgi:hypothetical protein
MAAVLNHTVHEPARPRTRTRRRVALLVASLVAAALVALPAGAAGPAFPSTVPLPDGFYPEGIAIGTGNNAYVGSLLDGAIYAADLRTGEGAVLVPGVPGRWVVGLAFDPRTGLLWAAGIDEGAGAVLAFDTRAGTLTHVVPVPEAGFLNDLVVTRQAVYVTDSFADRLYEVPLGPAGRLAGPATALPLSGDFQLVTDGDLPINLNGIEASANGRTLLAVHTSLGVLYRIDPTTGVATTIALTGGDLASGDGILLAGRTLYVVQNFLDQVAVVELSPDLRSGSVVDRRTSDEFRIPTTFARAGSRLYLVNARFDVAFPPGFGGEPVSIDYDVVRIRR